MATDTFTRADETPIAGTDWVSGPGGWRDVDLIGNAIRPHLGAEDAAARFIGSTFGADQFSQAKITAWSTNNRFAGVLVRIASNTQGNCYALLADSQNARYQILKQTDNGSSINSVSLQNIAVAPALNDVIRLEVSGTTTTSLKAFVNGSQIGTTQTDSTSPYTSGQPGVEFYFAGATTANCQLDDWSGGDLSVARLMAAAFTADANFAANANLDRPIAANMDLLGSFAAFMRDDRNLIAAFSANGDFSANSNIDRGMAAILSGDGNHGAFARLDRPVASFLTGSADFAANITTQPSAVLDSFNRPDETPLFGAGKWVDGPGAYFGINLIGNAIRAAIGGVDCASRYIGTVLDPNQFSKGRLTVMGGSGVRFIGIAVRMQSDTNASCYALMYEVNAATLRVLKIIDNGPNLSSQNLGNIVQTVNPDNTIKLSAVGTNPTTLRVFVNDVQVGSTITDSSSPYQTGQPAVIFYNGSANLAILQIDDFDAGSLGGTDRLMAALFIGSGDFNVKINLDRGMKALLSADGNHGAFARLDRPLKAALSADGNFAANISTAANVFLAANMIVLADFAAMIRLDRTIASSLLSYWSFTANLNIGISKLLQANLLAQADLATKLAIDRALKASFLSTADFLANIETKGEAKLAAVLTSSADFTIKLDVNRNLIAAFISSADFLANIGTTKIVNMAATLVATADFLANYLIERNLAAALMGSADFLANLKVEILRLMAATMTIDANWLANLETIPVVKLAAVLLGSADFMARFDAERLFKAALIASVDLSAALSIVGKFKPGVTDEWILEDDDSTWDL